MVTDEHQQLLIKSISYPGVNLLALGLNYGSHRLIIATQAKLVIRELLV